MQGVRIRFSEVDGKIESMLTFSDLKKVNQFSELLVRISSALSLNLEVLTQMSLVVKARESTLMGNNRCGVFPQILQDCCNQHTFLQHHVSLVKENADRLGVQVCRARLTSLAAIAA